MEVPVFTRNTGIFLVDAKLDGMKPTVERKWRERGPHGGMKTSEERK
jgi:hypothetical protein